MISRIIVGVCCFVRCNSAVRVVNNWFSVCICVVWNVSWLKVVVYCTVSCCICLLLILFIYWSCWSCCCNCNIVDCWSCIFISFLINCRCCCCIICSFVWRRSWSCTLFNFVVELLFACMFVISFSGCEVSFVVIGGGDKHDFCHDFLKMWIVVILLRCQKNKNSIRLDYVIFFIIWPFGFSNYTTFK